VQPPLLERELVDTFMSTLQGPYYEKMIGNISSGFADMVVIGERIEEGLKSGKIQGASNNQVGEKKFFNNGPKKKEGEANAVQHNHRQQQNVHQQKDPTSLERKNMPFDQVRFDPIPMSYGQILPYLIQKGMVEPRPLPPAKLPYPPSFDVNASCDYHAGSPGHDVESCRAFKYKVQELIDRKLLSFKEESHP
jgi:hypothetical protein